MINHKTCTDKTDEELVKLVLNDSDYYLCLMLRYEQKIKNYILRISGLNIQDVEDLTQNVFVKVYRNLNEYDSNFKLSIWIYRIAHNETISYLRKLKIRPKVLGEKDEFEILEKIASDENIEVKFEQDELKKDIKQILDKLNDKYKSVLVLKYLEEKDYKEISDILKIPMGTVATLINRAKKQFKTEYEKK